MNNFVSRSIHRLEPLLIEPSRAHALSTMIDKYASSGPDMLTMVFGERKVPYKVEASKGKYVGVIPMHGVIGKSLTPLEKMCGGVDCSDIYEQLEAFARDDSITAIMLDVDSPGGTVTGVPELAEQIRDVGKSKRLVAYTEGEACSAAYWPSSQASAFFATPSASVGSIGAYMAIPNLSKMYEQAGISIDYIKAGKYKAIGAAGSSLTDEHKSVLQANVNGIHSRFKDEVKVVRKYAKDDAMEGQVFTGLEASQNGLVTHIAKNRMQVIRKIA